MKIAILGSGQVGLALASKLVSAGHSVRFGVRNSSSAKATKAGALVSSAPILSVQEACSDAEVIMITTPPEAVLALIPQMGNPHSKIIIDATNSVRTRPEPYPTAFHAIKAIVKTQQVVKCFNTTGFENILNPDYPGFGAIDMFCAGDDKNAKEVAKTLSLDIGFGACWDFGGDDKVELLEKLALSWINLAIVQGHGRGLAFKVIRR
jgi:predicted dinucleotide-binding enzyme